MKLIYDGVPYAPADFAEVDNAEVIAIEDFLGQPWSEIVAQGEAAKSQGRAMTVSLWLAMRQGGADIAELKDFKFKLGKFQVESDPEDQAAEAVDPTTSSDAPADPNPDGGSTG